MPVPSAAAGQSSRADFAIVAPPQIKPGRHFVLEVWVAPSDQHAAMLEQATRPGRMIERGGRSRIDVGRDAEIIVMLELPDFEVDEPVEILGWNGDIRNVGFIVKVPEGLLPAVYAGYAKLMIANVPFASIWFDIVVSVDGDEAVMPAAPLAAHVRRIA